MKEDVYIVVLKWFWHKLNDFLGLPIFWKMIYYLCQIFYKTKVLQDLDC
jgi:DNA integrity scanning protein DisA with diadenylate cyclase activity